VRDNLPMLQTLCRSAACFAFGVALLSWPAEAQEKPVYRCPGPPVLYTDSVSPAEAQERRCKPIEGVPITIMQSAKPRPVASNSGGTAPMTSRPGDARIDPADQRARDSDAKRILADELKREEDKLASLRKDFNNGEPERNGDERNFQKYQDRVSEMKAALARKEADVAAIKRELAKLPQ
jgi:hypothetical protein